MFVATVEVAGELAAASELVAAAVGGVLVPAGEPDAAAGLLPEDEHACRRGAAAAAAAPVTAYLRNCRRSITMTSLSPRWWTTALADVAPGGVVGVRTISGVGRLTLGISERIAWLT
jgi:hypothetical protein